MEPMFKSILCPFSYLYEVWVYNFLLIFVELTIWAPSSWPMPYILPYIEPKEKNKFYIINRLGNHSLTLNVLAQRIHGGKLNK